MPSLNLFKYLDKNEDINLIWTPPVAKTPDIQTFGQGVVFNIIGLKFPVVYLLSNVVDLIFGSVGTDPSLFDQVSISPTFYIQLLLL